MADPKLTSELETAEKELVALQKKITELRHQIAGETVEDYELHRPDGSGVKLSQLFGDKDDLVLVHNMGKGCRWCTMWADGLNGNFHHIASRASFAVVSADPPEVAGEFAKSRGWQFTMLSTAGSEFAKDMGYMTSDGRPSPGISAFHRNSDGSMTRSGHTWFGPGDSFCSVYHVFDLLDGGMGKWEPQYSYDK